MAVAEIILFYCVLKMIFEAMTTSAVMDVPTGQQELPEPVKLRLRAKLNALCQASASGRS